MATTRGTLDKKPYNFSLDKKADVCGMGSDKKWALLANHYDRSLMRNSAALYMGGLMTNLRVHAAVDPGRRLRERRATRVPTRWSSASA